MNRDSGLPSVGLTWKLRHSLWLIGVVAGVGFFSFLAFGYVAARMQTRRSAALALIALASSAGLIALVDPLDADDADPIYGLLALICIVVLLVLAVALNIAYLRWHREELLLAVPPELPGRDNAGLSSEGHSWSPPTSRYQTPKEASFAASRLVFREGVLTWTPSGLRPKAVGGHPFSLTVGHESGAAQELVWIHGDVAEIPYRMQPIRADVLAICTADALARHGRRVLAYLPSDLVRPYRGVQDTYGDTDAVTEARIRAIAQATGLSFTTYKPVFNANLNKVFPGAMEGAFLVPASLYLMAMVFFALGATLIGSAVSESDQAGFGWTVATGVFGVLTLALSITLLPPVTRIIRRKLNKET